MHCNYAAFAAQYAPRVALSELSSRSDRPGLIIAVPLGMATEPDRLAALVPTDGSCLAAPHVAGTPLFEQMLSFTEFLPSSNETPQEMHITRDSFGDIAIALPCIFRIATARDAPPDPSPSPNNGKVCAAWCSLAAI